MKSTPFASLTLLLAACSATPPATDAPVPADIAQPCDALPVFEGKTSDDLVTYTLGLIDVYKACAIRHAGL